MLHFSISRAILALNHAMLIYYLVRLREITVDPVALYNNGFWAVGHFAQRLKTNCLVQLHFSVLTPCAITILSIGLCHSRWHITCSYVTVKMKLNLSATHSSATTPV